MDVGKNFLMERVANHWNGLAGECGVTNASHHSRSDCTLCYGLVDKVVIDYMLDSVILEVFSNLVGSVIYLIKTVFSYLFCILS